jgi:hypothetical protein
MTVALRLAAFPVTVDAYTADILRVLDQALVRREPGARRWFPGRI